MDYHMERFIGEIFGFEAQKELLQRQNSRSTNFLNTFQKAEVRCMTRDDYIKNMLILKLKTQSSFPRFAIFEIMMMGTPGLHKGVLIWSYWRKF